METSRLARTGIAVLGIGALLVGAAIVLDGAAARTVNGIGGVLWFAATAVLTVAAWRSRPPAWAWGVLAVLTIAVAFVVKPSALVPALVGFLPAGLAIAALVPRQRLLWAALVPAWYLPAHIGTAVLVAAIRSMRGVEGTLRTDPPPTAAIVPLLMVLAALLGGALAQMLMSRRSSGRLGERGYRNVEMG